jgi:protein-S-isoprenylcysteine O-methyltransferase Ste14
MPAALLIDAALLTVFALQHSIMARRWFKERWTQLIPWAIERSTYVLCASAALLLMFWQWRPLGGVIWTVENPIGRSVLWLPFTLGWGTVLMMTFLINHFDLFGLRQVWLPLIGRPYKPVAFRTPLPYRLVRHPLYLGFLLAFWSTPHMTLAHLVFALATTGYVLIGIHFEQKRSVVRTRNALREVSPSRPDAAAGTTPTGRHERRREQRRSSGSSLTHAPSADVPSMRATQRSRLSCTEAVRIPGHTFDTRASRKRCNAAYRCARLRDEEDVTAGR